MKSKICFISLSNIYLTPYLKKYTDIISIPYDLIYWNRHDIKEVSTADTLYPFEYLTDESSSKFEKLMGYIKFKKFAKKIIEENDYSGIVVLSTSAGMLLRKELKRHYPKKYIVDIRDYTMEKNPAYYYLEKNMIKNAALTVVSSKGYEFFLPKYDYVLCHNDINLSNSTINYFRKEKQRTIRDKIRISYIGLIRFHEQNKKVIRKFANDERFSLQFIGTDAFALSSYCKEIKANNVNLVDQFPTEKTLDYYKATDMINNLYGNDSILLNYALSNKLYYAALLGMPILVSQGTHMEKIACSYGFGYAVDMNSDTICDDIFNYYKTIDWNNFYLGCDKFLENVKKDNEKFKGCINSFILHITESIT